MNEKLVKEKDPISYIPKSTGLVTLDFGYIRPVFEKKVKNVLTTFFKDSKNISVTIYHGQGTPEKDFLFAKKHFKGKKNYNINWESPEKDYDNDLWGSRDTSYTASIEEGTVKNKKALKIILDRNGNTAFNTIIISE